MICEFCQYQHDNENDRYGCSNCCGGEYDIDNQGQQCPQTKEKVMDNNMLRIEIITKAGTTGWVDYLEIDQNWIDQMIAQEIPVAFQWQDENGKIGIKTGIVAAVLN